MQDKASYILPCQYYELINTFLATYFSNFVASYEPIYLIYTLIGMSVGLNEMHY
jgi:hypothetical protein